MRYGSLRGGNEVMVDTEVSEAPVPATTILNRNYPNPFSKSTTITYSLTNRSNVSIEDFDILGRRVESLIRGIQDPGEYGVVRNADNVPSGI